MTHRERLEDDRRQRMARLRAENRQEEQTLSAINAPVDESSLLHPDRLANEQEIRIDDMNDIIDDESLEGLDPQEQMKRLMGFGGFESTKGKAVKDNQTGASKGAAAKGKARVYRQYMNRRGGFNRALDTMK